MNRKPYPMTARCPENRRGTRTFRGYMHHMIGGNGVAGGMTAQLATTRQAKKAQRACEAGQRVEATQGRVIRAVMRCYYQSEGERADALFYGHP